MKNEIDGKYMVVLVHDECLFMITETNNNNFVWHNVFSNYEDTLHGKFDSYEGAILYAKENYTDEIQYFENTKDLLNWIKTKDLY